MKRRLACLSVRLLVGRSVGRLVGRLVGLFVTSWGWRGMERDSLVGPELGFVGRLPASPPAQTLVRVFGNEGREEGEKSGCQRGWVVDWVSR